MKILITGANGFLGSWLCQVAATEHDATVFALVRPSADTSQIAGITGVNLVKSDYSPENLKEVLTDLYSEHGTMDLVIHNAGLTKSTNRELFFKINEGITARVVFTIKDTKLLLNGTFAYVSSQAALGPVACGGPVSAYGESKLAAEQVIINSGLNYTIFRPTGIYGPRDQEFLALFKSVKMGLYPCAAPIKQKITMIHAYDVANNIISLSQQVNKSIIHLEDGHVYSHSDMKKFIEQALNKKSLMLPIPLWLTRLSLSASAFAGRIFGFDPILTTEKHGEITKDWDHDFSLERKEIPLSIKFDLHSGFANTYAYYKSENLV